MFGFRNRRRAHEREKPFPPAWLAVLERNVPYYQLLDESEQAELRGDIQVFLAEKEFEGCGGLEITDEIRVTIAAQACVLLLHRETDDYPMLGSILVYPHAYRAGGHQLEADGTVSEGSQGRLGESWMRGPIVLSWDDVLAGAADASDGRNVVFHEFAHQLDNESGAAEGAPALPRRSRYIAWARVLGSAYEQLQKDLEHHRRTLIDGYGATNPAEFFAVVTECFFEQGAAMRRRYPELYEQLREFYRQDPASREPGQEPSRDR